jgi:hypothetical protein
MALDCAGVFLMKLASYTANRPGIAGIGSRIIRFRFSGRYSHSEIVFEPGDGVDALMPDGTCNMNALGELWCASSAIADKMPPWSKYRAGKRGGVRLKRIYLDPEKWELVESRDDPMYAAVYTLACEGEPFSWRYIFKWLAWFMSFAQTKQKTCSNFCAAGFGIPEEDVHRYDPCVLDATMKFKLKGLP